MVRRDERKVRRQCEDVAEGPRFEEVEGYVGVIFEEGLEGDEALLELLVGIPVRFSLETRFGPAVEKVLHRVNGASDAIISDVDDVV